MFRLAMPDQAPMLNADWRGRLEQAETAFPDRSRKTESNESTEGLQPDHSPRNRMFSWVGSGQAKRFGGAVTGRCNAGRHPVTSGVRSKR